VTIPFSYIDDRTESIRKNLNPLYKVSKKEAIEYAVGMGASDSARGIAQLFGKAGEFFGWDGLTNRLKEKDEKLRAILEHPEYGTAANAAFLSSAIVADPLSYAPIVGWISKGKKAKNLKDLAIYGGASGAAVSSIGYTPEDRKGLIVDEDANLFERRLENAAIGGTAGAVIGSAGGAVVDLIQKARGKGSIFQGVDEIEPKKFDDDIVDEDELVKPITKGSIVRASDRKNIGTVIDLDEEKGIATVRFVNKETGNTATKRFTLDDLQPPKPGQKRKSNVKLDDEAAEKPKDIIFVIDRKTNKGNPIYKTTNSKNKTTYSIQKAVDEKGNIIPKQWEVTTVPFLRGRKKGESIADFNRRKKQLTEINLFGSLQDSQKFVRNKIKPDESVIVPNQNAFGKNVADELDKPIDQKYQLKNPVLKVYQDMVGTPLKNLMFNNPGESFSAVAGYGIGFNAIDDPDATYAQKVAAGITGAAIGAGGVNRIKNIKVGDEYIGEIFGRKLISDYGLKPEYLNLRQAYRTNKNEIGMEFAELAERASKELSPEQNKLLYGLLNGDLATIEKLEPEALALNAETRGILIKYGQELVDKGLLSEKVFKKNIDTYIKRTYLKPKKSDNKTTYENSKQIRLIGDELKPRGKIETITLKAFNNPKNNWKKEGWEILEELKGGKVKVRRQYTKQERKDLEEVENASYAIAETGRLFANDIASARFFDDLSKNKKFVLDEADWKTLTPNEQARFEIMPSSRVKDTKKLKYGELSGKYVDKDVLKDIKHMYGFSNVDKAREYFKILDSLQTLWKKTKTAWSPSTHVGNTASNVMLLDFADTKFNYVVKGIKEMRNPNSKLHRQAKIDGIFDVDLVSRELKDSLTEVEKGLLKIQNEQSFGLGIFGKTGDSIKNFAKWTPEKMEKYYQLEDQIFRMGVYMDRLDKGFSRSEAALEARKWFIDYDINAPFIQGLKRTAVPFISYTYRVIPLLAESAALRPHKFAKWAALGYGVNEGFTYLADDKYGEDIDRLTVRDSYNKKLFGGVPIVGDAMPYTNIRLPVDDKNGNALYFDVSRWIPGGDIFEGREGPVGFTGLPATFQPGGLYVDLISNVFFKVDPFTGQNLEDMGVNTESTGAILKHYGKGQIPNIPGLPETFATKKIQRARRIEAGEEEGELIPGSQYVTKDTPFLALAYGFGFRLRPQDARINKKVRELNYIRERNSIQKKTKDVEKDFSKGKITAKQKDERIVELQAELITLTAEYELYIAKLQELEDKLSAEGFKKFEQRKRKVEGGLVEGPEVPFTKENPANRVDPFTGEPYQEQMSRLGFSSGGAILNYIAQARGYEDPTFLKQYADDVKWQEVRGAGPTTVQNNNGPARGSYQVEGSEGSNRNETILQRAKNFYEKYPDAPKSKEIEYALEQSGKDLDFSSLSEDTQDALFYIDAERGKLPLDELASGKLDHKTAWMNYWNQGTDKEVMEQKWDKAQEEKIIFLNAQNN